MAVNFKKDQRVVHWSILVYYLVFEHVWGATYWDVLLLATLRYMQWENGYDWLFLGSSVYCTVFFGRGNTWWEKSFMYLFFITAINFVFFVNMVVCIQLRTVSWIIILKFLRPGGGKSQVGWMNVATTSGSDITVSGLLLRSHGLAKFHLKQRKLTWIIKSYFRHFLWYICRENE